jgi:hypothetical protein
MEKLIDRAKGRFRGVVAQLEETWKEIAYHARMVAKMVSNLMNGGLSGRHRR